MKKTLVPLLLALAAVSIQAQTKTVRFDMTGDSYATVEDVTALAKAVVGTATPVAKNDLNRDGETNVMDIVRLIDHENGNTKENGFTYVDLGLPSGTLWATMNVGAEAEQGYGNYYGWGETETRDKYDWLNYSLCAGSQKSISKYNNDIAYGDVDNKTELDLEDDAARQTWGGMWQMPNNSEVAELRNTTYCTWAKATVGDVAGYKVTSKVNGNSIFLPFTGYISNSTKSQAGSTGYYWTSTLNQSAATTAYCMVIDNSNFTHCNIRSWGRCVRAVIR